MIYKFNKNIIKLSFLILIILPYFAFAGGLEDSMKSFWDNIGAGGNLNSADIYHGQSAGYYTLGSIHQRNQVSRINPVSLQLPSARAGCGGIDLYLGSFSFINRDQFIALLKNIASSSTGFAFQLALETISPVIAEKTRELQDIIQKMNNFSINSCEQAQALVGGIWPKSDEASKTICETLGNSKGLFADAIASKHGCGSGGKRADTLNKVDNNTKTVDVNYAWQALKQSGILISGGSFDTKTAELLMTITGTIIKRNASNDNESSKVDFKPALIKDETFITKLLDGGSVEIYTCDEDNHCANPSKTKYSISKDTAFKTRVSNILNSIKTKIVEDNQLSASEIVFLNTTSLPIYKILNVYSAYAIAVSSIDDDTLAEVIALDIIYSYLEEFQKAMTTASKFITSADGAVTKTFITNLESNISYLNKRKQEHRDSFNATLELINRTQQIEQLLANKLTTQMSETINWSKAMGR